MVEEVSDLTQQPLKDEVSTSAEEDSIQLGKVTFMPLAISTALTIFQLVTTFPLDEEKDP